MSFNVEEFEARIANNPEEVIGNYLNTTQLVLGYVIAKIPNLNVEYFHGLTTWHLQVGKDIMAELRRAKDNA
mgnify:CR=1 FL=1